MPQPLMRPHRGRGDYGAVPPPDTQTAPPDWRHAAEAFLEDARSRGRSPATIANYRTYLLGPRAEQFLTDYEIRTVADITTRKLRDFQAELLDAGLSVGTAATFHRVIRNLLGFCRREGWGVDAGALEVPPPRQATIAPEIYTAVEEQRILEAARTGRDRFLLEFLLRTGLRLSEVAAVTVDDVMTDARGAYLRILQGKEGVDRIVPLDTGRDRFSGRLDAYVRNERPLDAKDTHLFLTTRRNPVTGEFGPLAAQGIKMLLRRIGQDTGIHVHAHKFRNTFATRALAAGVDSLVLQQALGLSSLTMVSRYAQFQTRDLRDAWRARTD
jgi:integrase/recombinase XerD